MLVKIPSLSITPSRLVTYNRYEGSGSKRELNEAARLLPKSNKVGRDISDKASKRLIKAMNWLIYLAKPKHYKTKATKSISNFKVNFITLTLPAPQAHTDDTIKKVVLNQWLTEMRQRYDLRNYVWRGS